MGPKGFGIFSVVVLEKREDDERWVKQFTKVLTGTIPKIGKESKVASRRHQHRLPVIKTDARAQCIRAGKHLITEKEWQAIAHNIEQVASNWSTGVVGTLNGSSQGLPDGLSNYGSSAQTAASAGACSGTVTANTQNCTTGGGTWYDDMREQKLSNGQTIWDFGGNVWEWVDQTVTNDYPIVNSAAAGWQACSTSGDGICGNTLTTNDQWYRGGFATIAGFIRGGNWSDGALGGAFALVLNNAPSGANSTLGFRCSR